MNRSIELRRVVVTGIGQVTPVGIGVTESWKNVVAGVSGAARFENGLEQEGFRVDFGCQVKGFDCSKWLSSRKARRLDRFGHYAVAAAVMAKEDAGLDLSELDSERCGVVFASGIGGILSVEEQLRKYFGNLGSGSPEEARKAARRISSFSIPQLMVNAGSGQIALEMGFRGVNYAPVSACSSGAHAAGLAFRHIQTGEAEVMLAGGSEAGIGIMGIGGFSSMKALSRRVDDPQGASRPFDRERDGFVQGEGAGAVLLEELEHAKARGAEIYCEFLGYGFTDDAQHITTPCSDGDGLARAMRLALRMGEALKRERWII